MMLGATLCLVLLLLLTSARCVWRRGCEGQGDRVKR